MSDENITIRQAGGLWLGVSRIWFLAATTFTQLLRMKALYFLFIFCLLIVGASTVNVFSYTAEQQLKLLKDVSLGAMSFFSSVFAIVATAMLIPRDLEDRTLYTILAKPVPRHSYLLGKLLGVLLVIAVTLVAMDVLFSGVLYLRQMMVVEMEIGEAATGSMMPEEAIGAYRERVFAHGLTWNLQNAVAAVFLKASVVAAATMLISTFASTTLFTIIVAFVVFFVGHVQSVARDYWLVGGEAGVLTRLFAGAVALVFPDFQLFNIVDGVVAGEAIPFASMLRLAGLTGMYLVVYTVVAYLFFADKEL